MKVPAGHSVSDHFVNKDPIVLAIYDRLLVELRKFGLVVEEPKKTSIHLVNKSALVSQAGIPAYARARQGTPAGNLYTFEIDFVRCLND